MFTGFTPETVDFLWGIRFNNNKTWFEANKEVYLRTLYRPMRALAEEIFDPFRAIPGMRCAVSRIYRDNRIPQPVPYKDHLWITIRQPDGVYWGDAPTLFFELWPDSYGYGFVFWGPRAQIMDRFRQRIALRPESFCALIEQAERESGVPFGGQTYKRRKEPPAPMLDRFYQLKNVGMYESRAIGDELYTPELAGQIRGKLLAMLPVWEYFQNLANETPRQNRPL